MTADFAITLNLLCNFQKKTSTVVSSKASPKVIPLLHIFRFLQHSIFGCISEHLRCQSVWEWCYDPFISSISWCNFQYKIKEHHEPYFMWTKLSLLLLCKWFYCQYSLNKFSVTFKGTVIFVHLYNSYAVDIIETIFFQTLLPISGCLVRSPMANWIRLTKQPTFALTN